MIRSIGEHMQTMPERSREQRMAALERANDVRMERARLKSGVTAGRLSAADVLLDPPAFAGSMSVFDLVLCVPKVGRVRAVRALDRAGVSLAKTLVGMTVRQRRALVGELFAAAVPEPESVRKRERRAVPARVVGDVCSLCGSPMLRPARVCGFCRAEEAEAA